MNTTLAPAAPSSSFNFKVFYALFLRRAWIVAVCFFGAIALAFIYVTVATPLYESTAVLQVEKQQQLVYTPADKEKPTDGDGGTDDAELKTIEQALELDGLLEAVVTDPALAADKNFVPGLVMATKTLPTAPNPDRVYTTHELAKRLKKILTIKLRHGTRLIDVSAEHPNPDTAQLITKTLINLFLAQNGRSQTDTNKMAMTFLEGQAERFKTDLQNAQDALQVYGGSLLLKDRILDQQKVVDDLTQRYRAKHPKLIEAEAELMQIEQQFDASISGVIANSPTEAAYWNANASNLAQENFNDRIANELKFVEARTNVLSSEGDTQSALFENVLKQMRESDVSKEVAPIEVDVTQPPSLPDADKPTDPPKGLVLALSALAGLVLGFGTLFILDGLDSSFKTLDEADGFINLPVLGMLPQVKRLTKKGLQKVGSRRKEKVANLQNLFFSKNIVVVNDPDAAAAENFRSLRASVALLGKEKDHRVLLFSSAMTDEGKTFVSCNYAVSLAQQGLKTLLIDADLRCPAVHEHFNIAEKTMGLIEHVSLGVPLSDVIQANVTENLDILLPGVKCPNPAEFLSGDGLKDVIQECLLKYDRIVLDTAPINVVSDTLLIVPYVQSVCMVVRLRQTPRGAVQRALNLLELTRVQPVGVVFNCVPMDWKTGYSKPGKYVSDKNYGRAYVKK